jgi:phosphopantothenoylcysteine decarboxylase/phosphopantothenate--cysteine ligase
MSGQRKKLDILVTAGPTQEMIDPVRFISNRSTGVMGFEIAKTAKRRGHRVTLISGPTCNPFPGGIRFIPIVTVDELQKAVMSCLRNTDCLFMVAAVSDWRVTRFHKDKIKRTEKTLALPLRATPDILKAVGMRKGKRVVVGFSLETGNSIARAKAKLRSKHLDLIVTNTLHGKHSPFGMTPLKSCLIDTSGQVERLPLLSKREIAQVLIDRVERLCGS